jgi:hypothetical protein
MISTKQIKIEDKEIALDIEKKRNAIIKQAKSAQQPRPIEFADLKFKEFGFPELKQIPKGEKAGTPKPHNDTDTFPLTITDTEEERYIPKRK